MHAGAQVDHSLWSFDQRRQNVGREHIEAFTRFFIYVVARIVPKHQKRSHPGNVD